MSLSTVALIILILFAVFVAVVLGLVVLAYVWRRRLRSMLQSIVLPDTRAIEKQFDEYRTDGRTQNVDELVKIIVTGHANKAGLIGAATGMGGIFLDVVGLPVDALSVLRVQASMIFLIAYAHGYRHGLSEEDKLRLVLVLSGSNQIVRYVGRYLLKIALTSVPVAGAVTGYILNYAALKGTGEVASRYFSGKLTRKELKNIPLVLFGKARALATQTATDSVNLASAASDKVKEMLQRSPL